MTIKQTPQSNTTEEATTSISPHLANINNYVVVLSSGAEDGGKRATLAFSAACTAKAMDLDTQLFLVGDGSHWAYQGSCDGISQKGFPTLASLMESFVELEGRIFVCSACDTVCSLPQDNAGKPQLRQPFIQPRGLASVMEHMVGGSSITF
ncbi:MAG: DsrE family protein [Candidatus Thiodiazotropha sp. (ex Ctena orbiculata)]|uniref:DsrE family protein n=1 Tax=Candidatus Thiodiazotropha taylori TaxID=2792791 RepID=A0A944M6L6_9GAMM|nr:DsrE family protein [Candidatus Thiodiazotropha taylori]MBT2988416.1 DsrE family protein [Candidatus Thiodiazotropha taylori]MBT2997323.1 DsrE family protein [Candidatus Thiodiazotropha taylori]MBT3000967.1 DsrE family protein [Candidatus Thiodiazotropha taylori]MBT3027786.1 DsrE family protein [Candidatus Thiodiazotropha taylori]